MTARRFVNGRIFTSRGYRPGSFTVRDGRFSELVFSDNAEPVDSASTETGQSEAGGSEAEPGQYITVARREKNGERWFVGSITAVDRRKSRLELNFLKPGKEYTATIYCDAKDADNRQNQARYTIRKQRVTSKSVLTLTTVNGGGYAISIVPTD